MAIDTRRWRAGGYGLVAVQGYGQQRRVGQAVAENPIPPGIYWVIAIGDDQIAELDAWLSWSTSVGVSVLRRVRDPGGWLEGLGGRPERHWLLFETHNVVPRWGPTLPLPQIAPKGAATQPSDTDLPPLEDAPGSGFFDDPLTSTGLGTAAWIVGGIVIAGVVIALVK